MTSLIYVIVFRVLHVSVWSVAGRGDGGLPEQNQQPQVPVWSLWTKWDLILNLYCQPQNIFSDKINVKIYMTITYLSAVKETLITQYLLRFTAIVVGVDADGKVPFVVQIIQRTKQRKAKKLSIRADLYRVRTAKIYPQSDWLPYIPVYRSMLLLACADLIL